MKIIFTLLLIFSSITAQELNYKNIDLEEAPPGGDVKFFKWYSTMYPEENYDDFAKDTYHLARLRTLKKFIINFQGSLNVDLTPEKLLKHDKLMDSFYKGSFANVHEEFNITDVLASKVAKDFGKYEFNIFDYPYFFKGFYHVEKFIESPVGQQLCDELINEKVVCLGFLYANGFRYIKSDAVKAESVSDFEKIYIGQPEGELNIAYYNMMGVKLINEDTPEEYKVGKKIDLKGEVTSGDLFLHFNGEPGDTKYLNATKHSVKVSVILMRRNFYDLFSDKEKIMTKKLFKEIAKKQRKYIMDEEKAALKDVKKLKIPVIELGLIQRQVLANKMKRFDKKYKGKFDKNFFELVQTFDQE